MSKKMMQLFLKASFITILLAVPGCNQKSYEKQQYLLDVQRTSAAADTKNTNIIEVRRFTIDPAFSSKQFTYRIRDFEYKSDFYNEFFTPPAIMITEKTRNWLSESGLFQRVSESAGFMTPSHIIEGNIIALYGDFRDISSPKAVMEIRVCLLETKSGTKSNIIFSKTYKSSAAFESGDSDNLIAAFDRCLSEILTNIEKDLKNKLF